MSAAPANPLGVGLHDGIPPAVYHADPTAEPSLSSGIARKIHSDTPAHAYLEHPRLGGTRTEPTADMIFGSYGHAVLSGETAEFEVGNWDNYTTKAAKEWRDGVKLSGKTPILEKTADRCEQAVKALREKLAPDLTIDLFTAGKPEVTAVWTETASVQVGIKDGKPIVEPRVFWNRARYDRLVIDPGGFADIWDWKFTNSVATESLIRGIMDKGYHVQAAHYLRGLRVLIPEYAGRFSFIFGFVETEPPFAVRRVVLSEAFLQIGSTLLNRATARWQHCLTNNTWPDDSGTCLTIEPPSYYAMRVLEGAAA